MKIIKSKVPKFRASTPLFHAKVTESWNLGFGTFYFFGLFFLGLRFCLL